MTESRIDRVLTLNGGSSSLKFALFEGSSETHVLSGLLDRFGLSGGRFRCRTGEGRVVLDRAVELANADAAVAALLGWLEEGSLGGPLHAVGHRLVHGGPSHDRPERITPALLEELRELVPLAPNHLPGEIAAIDAVARSRPGLVQVGCFDTAFHRTLDSVARLLPVPRTWVRDGLQRYGFHGLSYEGIVRDLRRDAGEAVAEGRLIVAHLGNGSSLAAIHQGRSVDTTMGLTPLGGLVMGTRPGDLDPGVLLHLLRQKGVSPSDLEEMLTHRSGLLGVSGATSDMRDLLSAEAVNPQAAEAVELYCRQARKFVGAFAAILGGVDAFVFTGGIGENAPRVRRGICQGLEFLGIRIDGARNDANEGLISVEGSPVPVYVMKASEERVIARHTRAVLRDRPPRP